MSSFYLIRHCDLNRDVLFSISTNVFQFHKILPNYFKSLKKITGENSDQIVLEKISFLGQTIDVKTRHIIQPPNIHKVLILSGPLKGTSFIESYGVDEIGTVIKIFVNLQISGFLKFIPLLDKILKRKMNKVMSEFITCSEIYAKTNNVSN